MSQTLHDSRRLLFRRVAAVGAVGVTASAGLDGVLGEEAAAAERRASRNKSCRRFKNKSKRQRCRRRKRRQRRKSSPTPATPTPTSTSNPPVSPPSPIPTPALLRAPDRHVVSRFSFGINDSLARQVSSAGGARAWFEQQLEPSAILDDQADEFRSWWPGLARSAQDLWTRQKNGVEGGWEVMEDYQRWLLARRMHTQRQVAEVMTDFWMNHLHIPVNGDAQFTYRIDYDNAIRTHALGRFDDLLLAAITHPAMGIYLDNAVSTAQHPNENLGRELLELHTVGRGNYDETDVKNSARILTGYRVDMWKTFNSWYSAEDHWRGPVQVMDFSDPNAAADGRPVTERYLRFLARHPSTARRIARKLAVKFVHDSPSETLVNHLAQVYLDNDTAIKPVLRALIDSTEFRGSAGMKVRDPAEDLVATYRVLNLELQAPPDSGSNDWGINAALWQARSIGAAPGDWARPDGAPADNESWSSPARLVASMDQHWNMSGGWWPGRGITYKTPTQWLPAPSLRFDELVSHLSRQLLHQPATEQLQAACRQAVPNVSASTVISATHPVIKWNFHRLLVTFLDSPAHLAR